MWSSKCAFSAGAALYRIFVQSVPLDGLRLLHRNTSISVKLRPVIPQGQRRNYYVPFNAKEKAEKSRLPRNDEIRSFSVIVIGDDGKMTDPRPTSAVLAELDLSKAVLQVVAQGERGMPPICRIQDKMALRNAEKAQRRNQRKTAMGSKELELNWAIEAGDLKHRIKKMKEFLQKGHRVDVILAAKRKGKRATQSEAQNVIDEILQAMKEVDGAREYKPREGKLLQQLVIFMEGKKLKPTQAVTTKKTPPSTDMFGDDLEPEFDGEDVIRDFHSTRTASVRSSAPVEKKAPAENPALAALRRAAGMR